MADVLDQPQAIPQPKPKRTASAAFLAHCWTPERARAAQIKARQVREANKARITQIAQDGFDPEAIRLEQVKNIRAKLKTKLTPAEYAGWMRNLRELGGLPPPNHFKPDPKPAKEGPINPLV